jgi:hypothetical protein
MPLDALNILMNCIIRIFVDNSSIQNNYKESEIIVHGFYSVNVIEIEF